MKEITALLDLSEKWGFRPLKQEAQGLIGEILDQRISGLESKS